MLAKLHSVTLEGIEGIICEECRIYLSVYLAFGFECFDYLI